MPQADGAARAAATHAPVCTHAGFVAHSTLRGDTMLRLRAAYNEKARRAERQRRAAGASASRAPSKVKSRAYCAPVQRAHAALRRSWS